MKPLLALLLLLLHFPSNNALQADIIDDLSVQFRTGNSKEIAKNFAASVELIIIDQEDVYSKAQSEQILKDFFVKNPPNKSTIIHRLSNSPNYRLGILSLNTKNGKFRVTITLKLTKPSNNFLISELRIEQDKE
ncbi:DUF4783 domain-containing protein [Pedobacter polaris]|uniref:DUF4783 domain-containing protein n=2 Tax=Pedobacter polaris TaxID=2571273 RepID=A0A4U1CG13_9SPHI|nr:DUF4783 domain-containing protein [Pedobacter polaris]